MGVWEAILDKFLGSKQGSQWRGYGVLGLLNTRVVGRSPLSESDEWKQD